MKGSVRIAGMVAMASACSLWRGNAWRPSSNRLGHAWIHLERFTAQAAFANDFPGADDAEDHVVFGVAQQYLGIRWHMLPPLCCPGQQGRAPGLFSVAFSNIVALSAWTIWPKPSGTRLCPTREPQRLIGEAPGAVPAYTLKRPSMEFSWPANSERLRALACSWSLVCPTWSDF